MDRFYTQMLKRVPQWLLVVVLVFVLCWFGGLSYIAFFTSRSVEFFPPRIGPDPKIVREFEKVASAAKGIRENYNDQVNYLRKQLCEERQRVASARTFMSLGYFDHKDNVEKYEKEIASLEIKLSQQLQSLEATINSLEKKVR